MESQDFNLRLSIIVPMHNEVKYLREVLEGIKKSNLAVPYELLVVDSGSTDGSTRLLEEIAGEYSVRPLFLKENRGKGFAVRHALSFAQGDLILIQDADLEYDPSDYPSLVEPLLRGEQSFVMGSRRKFAGTWRYRSSVRPSFYFSILDLGSEITSKLFCFLFGAKISDVQTMFKVFRKELIHDLTFQCEGFDFDVELLGALINRGHMPLEVPVRYYPRTKVEGKKLRLISDGVSFLYALVRMRFNSALK